MAFFRPPFGGNPLSEPESASREVSEEGEPSSQSPERRIEGSYPAVTAGGAPLSGLFRAIGDALKLPGIGRGSNAFVSEHDPYGFKRSSRYAQWEVAWEAKHAKQEVRQELLWMEHDGDRRHMEPTSGGALGLAKLV